MAQSKERLDKLMVARGLAPTRAQAQAMVMAGEVRVAGQPVTKSGLHVAADAIIEVTERMPYVSRGGYKLAAGLDAFDLSVAGRVCADVGACTGGFTDVLIQRGAAKVFAIDVGYGQLAWRLRQDSRVTVMERTNARHLTSLGEAVDLAVVDVSFISLRLILPAVKAWLAPAADIIMLVKPQFEAGRAQVGKGGIVKDRAVHEAVLTRIWTWCLAHELGPAGLIRSPITGNDGNVEFLAWCRPGRPGASPDPAPLISAALQPA